MNDDRSVVEGSRPEGGRHIPEISAREVFRRWMRDIDGDELNRVGSVAILQSADSVGQFANMARGPSAEMVLLEVEKFAIRLTVPATPPPRWRWFRKSGRTDGLPPYAIAALIHQLDRRRDDGTRRIISLKTVRTRLEQSELALQDALHLIDALELTVEAGTRELRVANPERAAAVWECGSAMLIERRRAVLTQSSIHRQSMMTLDLLMANQQTLNAALEQTRTITLSALQVASAAKRATADATVLRADATSAQVRRTLYDALEQARNALAATNHQEDGRVLDRQP